MIDHDDFQRAAEIALARHMIGMLNSMALLCLPLAPKVTVVLQAAAEKLRDEYPEAKEEEPEA